MFTAHEQTTEPLTIMRASQAPMIDYSGSGRLGLMSKMLFPLQLKSWKIYTKLKFILTSDKRSLVNRKATE